MRKLKTLYTSENSKYLIFFCRRRNNEITTCVIHTLRGKINTTESGWTMRLRFYFIRTYHCKSSWAKKEMSFYKHLHVCLVICILSITLSHSASLMTGKKLSADGERPVLHIEMHAWERFRGIFHRQLPLMFLCSNISSLPAYRGLCFRCERMLYIRTFF